MLPVFLILGGSEHSQRELNQHLQLVLHTSVSASLTQAPLVSQGICLCCQLHNETSSVLRDLFMQAMQKKRSAFSHVLLSCGAGIDPASVVYTLEQDFFLKERFRWLGSFCSLDRLLVQAVLKAGASVELSMQAEESVFDVVSLQPYMNCFAQTDVFVVMPGSFNSREEEKRFVHLLAPLYAHIQLFYPDTAIPEKIELSALTREKITRYQNQWSKRKSMKRHRLFR